MKTLPIMAELEILQRRIEILEKGFQEIIALIKKDDCDDGFEDIEDDTCDCCGRGADDDGQCPLCCDLGMYAPGSEECDFCEHSFTCSKHAANL